MKQIFLHIGTPKTGTTALQNFLFKYSEKLSSQGILYSRNFVRGNKSLIHGHHSLAYDVLGTKGLGDGRCWNLLLEEIKSSKSDVVVISAEAFWLCTEKEIQKVAKYLEGYSVKVVVYLRNPFKFLISLYKQFVKKGRYNRSFHDFIDEYYTDYGYSLALWASVFGKENIKVCIYDKMEMNHGLEEDFLRLLSVDPNRFSEYFLNKQKVNVSPPDWAIILMRRLNRFRAVCQSYKLPTQVFNWTRANILRKTIPGRTILTFSRPFVNGKLYNNDDVDYLRKKVLNDKPLLNTFIPIEDQLYLNF
jgi:hypothetical protein